MTEALTAERSVNSEVTKYKAYPRDTAVAQDKADCARRRRKNLNRSTPCKDLKLTSRNNLPATLASAIVPKMIAMSDSHPGLPSKAEKQ